MTNVLDQVGHGVVGFGAEEDTWATSMVRIVPNENVCQQVMIELCAPVRVAIGDDIWNPIRAVIRAEFSGIRRSDTPETVEDAPAIFNADCIAGALQHFPDKCIDLGIFDPPFGIKEGKFDRLYNRKKENVIEGYVEAPSDYFDWTLQWMTQAKRVLKDNGSMYVVTGHTPLRAVLNAAHKLDLVMINHIIWRYNFGVHTKRKFVTSHYSILYLAKSRDAALTFNTYCRRTPAELDMDGHSLLEADLSSVWRINREFHRGKKKNCNKLPNELVRKMIQYSSNPGDTVCDFFLGNFTTALCARKLGREICGFELNPAAYEIGMQTLNETAEGCDLQGMVVAPQHERI